MRTPILNVVESEQAAAACVIAHLVALSGSRSRVLCISGAGPTLKLAEAHARIVGRAIFVVQATTKEPTLASVRSIASQAQEHAATAVLSVGGGSVVDVSKVVAFELNLPHVVLAAALSSDAIASPIAVLRDSHTGRKNSQGYAAPDAVVVNTELTIQAPRHLTCSGIFDGLSNASALLDVALAAGAGRHTRNVASEELSRTAYRLLLGLTAQNCAERTSHAVLAESLALSGKAMLMCGTSVPCSGAEHLVSHALDFLGLGHGTHGIQVGVGTVFCHHLRLACGLPGIEPQVMETLDEFKVAYLHPRHLGISKPNFLRAVAIAAAMRPNRYSVLSEASSAMFEEVYESAFEERMAPQPAASTKSAHAVLG
ncbi:MAG: iron-containing alcohol dehydrogenase [Pseudomonadota bacterium]